MKYIKLLILITITIAICSCENGEVEFPDFDYTAVYFPVQYPVRTLSLGNDLIDNTLDKELTFKIGVSVGGMYENNKDWIVKFKMDKMLADNLINEKGDTLAALPDKYIESISPAGEAVIPKGSFNGWITIKLNEAFLDDPIALSNRYVVPLIITETNADSILTGKPAVSNPDKRVSADWDANVQPKDFTLYGIKFINKLHGSYLHRGVIYIYDASNTLIETKVFRNKYITQDQIVKLTSDGKNSVITNFIGNTVSDDGENAMIISVDGSENLSVSGVSTVSFQPVGNGKFINASQSNESWGDTKRDALYLEYTYTDSSNKRYEVKDTLVFRDRGIVPEFQTLTVFN